MKKYFTPSLLALLIFVTGSIQAQTFIEVGNGTIQNSMPVYSSWNYSWSSLIYNQADLGSSKTITSIGLHCTNGPKTVPNQKVYMKLSSAAIFSNAGYEDPANNGYTLVYEGSLTFQTGWNEIVLAAPFAYDGVQNLIIHWENRWGNTYGPMFNATSSAINNNKNCGSDIGFPGTGSTGYLNPYPSALTNMRFYYPSDLPATPQNPYPADNATVIPVDTYLSWTLGANTETYDLYFGTNPDALNLIAADVPAVSGVNTYNFNDFLADSTWHYWRVAAKNSTIQELSPVWDFKTEVVIDEFPYNQGFEDSTVFHTWPVQSAWVTIPEFSWYESEVNPHSGSLCAKAFKLGSSPVSILRSPRIFLPENHRITFNWANTDARVAGHDTTFFEVSSNGGNSWQTLAFLSPDAPSTYVEQSVDLSDFSGTNFFFRYRYVTDQTLNAASVYLDDITIEEISNVPEIELSTAVIPFRELYSGGQTYENVTITNPGSVDLVITSTQSAVPFSCSYSGTIPAGTSVEVPVYFIANTPGSFSGNITFVIEGAFSGNNQLSVSGLVLEPGDELFETFDASVQIPEHWNKIISTTDPNKDVVIITSSFDPHSVPNVARMLNANDIESPLLFIMPGLTGFDSRELSFWAKKGGDFYDLDVVVGLMDDPYHAESFVPVQTMQLTPEHTEFTVVFPASNNKPYIAFKHGDNVAWASLWIDDVEWTNPTAGTPPNPANVLYPANSAQNVDLMLPADYLIWANGGGAPVGYRLSLGTDNPPTNMLNQADLGDTLIYSIVNDLDFNTVYYWQIVPYNEFGNAVNCPVWSFTTMNDPLVNNFPFSENFDALIAGSAFYYPPFLNGNVYPIGWTDVSVESQNMSWTMIANSSGNPNIAHSAPNAMHMGWSFLTPMDEWLITPPMQLKSDKIYGISFVYKTASVGLATSEKLELLVGSSNEPSAFTQQLFNDSNVTSLDYVDVKVNYTPASDGIYYFAFHGYSDPLQFLLFVDDVHITEQTIINTELNSFADLQVYPNPASDFVNIVLPGNIREGEIRVMDMTGRLLLTDQINVSGHRMSTRSLKKGIYLLQVNSGADSWNTRIVVE